MFWCSLIRDIYQLDNFIFSSTAFLFFSEIKEKERGECWS